MRRASAFLALVVLLACAAAAPTLAKPVQPPAGPAFVELQGRYIRDDRGPFVYSTAFVKNISGPSQTQVTFRVRFTSAGKAVAPDVVVHAPLFWYSPGYYGAMLDQWGVAVPAGATDVAVTATLEHVAKRTGTVDQTYASITGAAAIPTSAPTYTTVDLFLVRPATRGCTRCR